MAVNRTKILREAERFTQQGRIEQAIARYQQLMKGNPRDVGTVNKIGDLYARIGKIPQAVKQFLTTAEFYATDGFLLKAIAIYKKVTKLDPGNTHAVLKLGELYNQQGLPFEAKAQFQSVAEKLASGGEHGQAIEVYQKILQMDSTNMRARVQIAELESRQGNFDAALQMYREVGEELRKKGKTDECQRVLERALEVQPGHGGIARSLASLFLEKGQIPKALSLAKKVAQAKPGDGDAVALLAETYLKAGRTDDAEKIIAQVPPEVVQECPELQATKGRLELARGRVERAEAPIVKAADLFNTQGKPDHAIHLLQEMLQADPMRAGALRRLREFHKEREETDSEREVWFRLVDALENRGMVTEAIRELKELQKACPDDGSIPDRLQELDRRKKRPAPDSGPEPAGDEIEVLDRGEEIEVEVAGEDLAAETSAVGDAEETEIAGVDYPELSSESAPASVPGGEGEPGDEQEEAVRELLTEAEVFTKYRLIEKAEERLQKIVNQYPGYIPAQERLKELYFEEGNKEKSVQQCLLLAELFRKKNDTDRMVECLEEAGRIDPKNPEVRRGLQALKGTPASEEVEEDEVVDPGEEAEVTSPGSHEEYQDMSGEVEIDWDDDSPAGAAAPEESPAPPQTAEEPARVAGKPATPSREKLREVDFFLEQGLWEEAESILQGIGPRDHGHPEIRKRWEELDAGRKPSGAAPAQDTEFADIGDEVDRALGGAAPSTQKKAGATQSPPAPTAADFFDLASELEKEIREVEEEEEIDEEELLKGINVAEENEHSMEEVFQAFKKGVEEQVDSKDFDTHYQLGIAYKEMGLIDEAIGEFQYAAKDRKHFMDCCSILGLCFKDKGMVPLAEKWYRKALETKGFSEEEYQGVRYDLACLLAEIGKKADALQLFTEVYGIDTKYRDVSDQIKKLRKEVKE